MLQFKAVLSHALAALSALNMSEGQVEREAMTASGLTGKFGLFPSCHSEPLILNG